MKNDTQKFNVGDEVEVTNKKLKSYGAKGVVKELGYDPFLLYADGTVGVHDFTTTGHDCLVSLQSGSTIRIKDENIKVIKKNTTTASTAVDFDEYYNFTHQNGYTEQVYVFDCEFNKTVDGPYVLAMNLNTVPVAHFSLYTIPHISMEKITNKDVLERLQDVKDRFVKRSTTYTVVIEGRKMSSFLERSNKESYDPYFHEKMYGRSFYNRRTMCVKHDSQNKDTFEELRSKYDTSFTVRGDGLNDLIKELILDYGVVQENIKVYKLQAPQSVSVKVDIDIK